MSLARLLHPSPPARDTAPRGSRRGRAALLLGLALLSLDSAGCSSFQSFRDRLGCNGCGGGLGGLRDRLFSRRATPMVGGCDTCGGGAIGGELIEVAPGPAAIAVPGGPLIVPGKPTIVTPGAVGAPGGDADVPSLEELPAPSASNRPAPAAGRVPSTPRAGTNPKTNYQTSRGAEAPRASRQEGLAQAHFGPAVARRSPPRSGSAHPLDHLPPLPGEVEATSAVVTVPATAPPAQIDPEDILDRPIAVPASPPPADATPEPAAGAGVADATALGIRLFRSIDAQVAGGSFPDADGLVWLRDKGYRTIIDIRDSGEVSQAEVDAIAHLGMKHVRLPLNPRSIDSDLLDRFDALLRDSSSRPIYFCDTDGNRAGLMWFLHRRTADPVAADLAAREAEQVGLKDSRLLLYAAEHLLRRNRSAASPASDGTAQASDGAAVPVPQDLPDADLAEPTTSPLDDPSRLQPPPVEPPSPTEANWNSYAAPVAALLCVPLAYWGRTTVNCLGSRLRASLPAPARQPRSLPRGSDV